MVAPPAWPVTETLPPVEVICDPLPMHPDAEVGVCGWAVNRASCSIDGDRAAAACRDLATGIDLDADVVTCCPRRRWIARDGDVPPPDVTVPPLT